MRIYSANRQGSPPSAKRVCLALPHQDKATEEYLQRATREIENAISSFQPQLIFYIAGSDPGTHSKEQDALVFRLAVDKHAIPLVSPSPS